MVHQKTAQAGAVLRPGIGAEIEDVPSWSPDPTLATHTTLQTHYLPEEGTQEPQPRDLHTTPASLTSLICGRTKTKLKSK